MATHATVHQQGAQGTSRRSWLEDAFWICCVRCRAFHSSQRCPYFITNCGHIYCSKCRETVAASQCTVCKRKGIEFLPITEDIRDHPAVGFYFMDVPERLTKIAQIMKFHQTHMSLNRRFLQKDNLDEASLLSRFGPIAALPMEELEKRWSEEMERRRQHERELWATCSKVERELTEIEAIGRKLKSMGFTDEDILSINQDGRLLPSVRIMSDARGNLQQAKKLLGLEARARQVANPSGNAIIDSPAGGMASGGGQSLRQPVGMAGMVTPQQQRLGAVGGVGQSTGGREQTRTPHQFGLTPFQRLKTPPASVSTPTSNKLPLPPPPPPPFSTHLLQAAQASPAVFPNKDSPMSWQTSSTGVAGMPPPRLPPTRKGSFQGRSPSPLLGEQQLNRQILSSQSLLTPVRQEKGTPLTNRYGTMRSSPSGGVRHAGYGSPAQVATGSAVGRQVTPTRCCTPTNQMSKSASQQSLPRSARASPSPSESLMSPCSVSSRRTPMSVHSASPSPYNSPWSGGGTPTNKRVSIRGPPSGGKIGSVTKTKTPEGTPVQQLIQHCSPRGSGGCYSTPQMSMGRTSGGSNSGGSGGRRRTKTHVSHYPSRLVH